jgi:hypothetical protein
MNMSIASTRLKICSREFLIIAVALISAASLTSLYQARAQSNSGKVPLTHETMWMMKRVGAPVPSPNGKWVVFSLVEPAYDEKDQVSDLWCNPGTTHLISRRRNSEGVAPRLLPQNRATPFRVANNLLGHF